MKIASCSPQSEFHNQEVQILLGAQLHHRGLLNALPAPFQQKPLVRIVQTILRSSHYDVRVEKSLQQRVFYRKPLLTNQGKLDKERLVLEILFLR